MFLEQNTVGIDISDTHIRLMQLSRNGEVMLYGEHQLPAGLIEDGRIRDEKGFIREFQTALTKTAPVPVTDAFVLPRANIGLPDKAIWSHTEALPGDIRHEDAGAYIAAKAAEILPITVTDMNTDHVLTSVRGTTYATFAAADPALVDSYTTSLSKAGLTIGIVGSGVFSLARAVLPRDFGTDNYLLIDTEPDRTYLGVFDEHAVAYMLVESVPIPPEAFKDDLIQLREEVDRLRAHFLSVTGESITRILLGGRRTDTPALLPRLETTFDIPVALADPLVHIRNADTFSDPAAMLPFAHAVGLAQLATDASLPHIDLRGTNRNEPSEGLRGQTERLLRQAITWLPSRRLPELAASQTNRIILAAAACLAALTVLFIILFTYLF